MEITIDLKNAKKSSLCIRDYVYLQMISDGIDPLEYEEGATEILEQLCKNMWLKPMKGGYVLRGEARELLSSASNKEAATEVLDYLNEIYKKIKPKARGYDSIPSNMKFINGRLREGNTVEDLKAVIDTMYVRWKNTKFEDYFRPSTLFNAEKFQTYINYATTDKARRVNTGHINEIV